MTEEEAESVRSPHWQASKGIIESYQELSRACQELSEAVNREPGASPFPITIFMVK
jgi:hypothetical protein